MSRRDARDPYESALEALRLQRPDPLALAREALARDPGFVAAQLLEAWLLLWSRDARDFRS